MRKRSSKSEAELRVLSKVLQIRCVVEDLSDCEQKTRFIKPGFIKQKKKNKE